MEESTKGQGINKFDTPMCSMFDTQVIRGSVFNTRPTLVTTFTTSIGRLSSLAGKNHQFWFWLVRIESKLGLKRDLVLEPELEPR
jgi:hypothetical protein